MISICSRHVSHLIDALGGPTSKTHTSTTYRRKSSHTMSIEHLMNFFIHCGLVHQNIQTQCHFCVTLRADSMHLYSTKMLQMNFPKKSMLADPYSRLVSANKCHQNNPSSILIIVTFLWFQLYYRSIFS